MEKINNEKYLEILKAAVALFSERGYERTTVDEIAARANVGKGTIYLHFENKEKIFFAILEGGIQQVIERLNEILCESGDFQQKFQSLLKHHLQFAEKHRDFYKFFLKEYLSIKSILDRTDQEKLIEMHQKAEQLLAQFFQIGIDRQQIRKGDPSIYTYIFGGIISHFTFHWLIEKGDKPLTEQAPVIMDLFLNGVGTK